VCQGAGCCSVCQKWNVGVANPGSACLGKYVGYQTLPNGSVVFTYTGGDPVPPPGPPDPGPRQTFLLVNPNLQGNTNGFTNITYSFIPEKGPDGSYDYYLTAKGPLSYCYMDKVINNCNKCLSAQLNSSCEWCLESNSCMELGTVQCRNTVRSGKYCPLPCSQMTTCKQCTTSECVWCNDPTECSDSTNNSCQYEVQDPQYCPAENFEFLARNQKMSKAIRH